MSSGGCTAEVNANIEKIVKERVDAAIKQYVEDNKKYKPKERYKVTRIVHCGTDDGEIFECDIMKHDALKVTIKRCDMLGKRLDGFFAVFRDGGVFPLYCQDFVLYDEDIGWGKNDNRHRWSRFNLTYNGNIHKGYKSDDKIIIIAEYELQ